MGLFSFINGPFCVDCGTSWGVEYYPYHGPFTHYGDESCPRCADCYAKYVKRCQDEEERDEEKAKEDEYERREIREKYEREREEYKAKHGHYPWKA